MTPGRVVELNDWVADTLGAIVAVSVYRSWSHYRSVLSGLHSNWKSTAAQRSQTN